MWFLELHLFNMIIPKNRARVARCGFAIKRARPLPVARMSARKMGELLFSDGGANELQGRRLTRMSVRLDDGLAYLLFAGTSAIRAISFGSEDVRNLAGSVAVAAIGARG